MKAFSTENLTLDEAATRMRGPIGSLVTLLIEREGEGETEIRVVRDRIALNPVVADLRFSPARNADWLPVA